MIETNKGVLVTGANGLLGSHILRDLLDQGYSNLYGYIRPQSDLSLVDDIKDKVTWMYGDLLDIFALESAMKNVSVVIHSAGMVSYNLRKTDEIYSTNETGTANVVNTALALNIDKLVHISSIAALGRDKQAAVINENVKWNNSPNNTIYAKSKYLAEQQAWRGYFEGLPVTILNPSIILGVGNWDLTSLKFLPKIEKGNKFYPLGGTGYVDVKDVAALSTLSINHKYDGERYIVSSQNLTFKEFFDQVSKALGTKPPSIKVNSFLAGIGWRIDWVKSLLFGTEPILTKETVINASKISQYENSKSVDQFGFVYRDIDKTIEEMVIAFKARN